MDTLISLKYQCFSLGWIDNQGILSSLDKKLESVKSALERGQIKTAKNILNAFMNEVKAQRGKHLTDEAYFVLWFNAQFFLNKL